MTDSALAVPRAKVGRLLDLWPFLRPYRLRIVGALISLGFAASAMLLFGQALRRLVDNGFDSQHTALLDQYFAGLLGVVLLLALATFGRFYLVSSLGERVIADLREAVFGHLLQLDMGFYETAKSGEILSRLNADTMLIEGVIGSSASVALRNLLMFLGGAVLMVVTSAKLAGLMILVVPLVVAPIILFGRQVRKLSRSSQDRLADSAAIASESLGAVATVQAYTQETGETARYVGAVEAAFRTALRRIRARAWLTALVIVLIFGAIDAILWIGAKDVVHGVMTGGELAGFIFYAVVVAGSLGALSEVWGDLQRAAGATERLLDLLQVVPAIAPPAVPAALPQAATGRVAFQDITFFYPSRPDRAALRDLSLAVKPGETVALVGPSGAGKTTLFQLLLRFYDPQSGQVMVDGVDIARLDPVALRRCFALVPQETIIFGTTVAANIRYGRPEASDAELRAAAEAASALGFIEALPKGFDTELGERGVRLSGGQRQRIAIARAILRDPKILLLDEATSALDAESEVQVQGALERLMRGRTTLVIAHRLATVINADRIIVLDEGRIVESGRHDDLIIRGGLYSRLAQLQFADGTSELADKRRSRA